VGSLGIGLHMYIRVLVTRRGPDAFVKKSPKMWPDPFFAKNKAYNEPWKLVAK
jgi:hypothetical protein